MEWKIEAEICAGFALFFTCTSQKMYMYTLDLLEKIVYNLMETGELVLSLL